MRIILMLAIIGALLPGCKKDVPDEVVVPRAERVIVTELAGTTWVTTYDSAINNNRFPLHIYREFTKDSMFQTDDAQHDENQPWFHYSYYVHLPFFSITQRWRITRWGIGGVPHEEWHSISNAAVFHYRFATYGDSLYAYTDTDMTKAIFYGVKEK